MAWKQSPENTARIRRVLGLEDGKRQWAGDAPVAYYKNHQGKQLHAVVSRDDLAIRRGGEKDMRWHISVSLDERVPTWEEMVMAAHELRPGVVFVIGMPPRSWWINIHPNVLHLYETKDEHLIDQWRYERMGMKPT